MGLEGIVSKRRSSSYRSGRSPHWLKAKNPESPAVRREALEDFWPETVMSDERAIIAVRDWMGTF